MDKNIIEKYRRAGKIAAEVVAYARGEIRVGMKLLEIAEKIEGKIRGLGGEVAFPVNLSMNEVAAHYTPTFDDETIAEGLLKVDIGVSVDGFIADTAFSIDLSEDGKYKKMIETNEEVLENVLNCLGSDAQVCDVSNYVSEIVGNSDYNIVKNLSGHSLGENLIHAGLTIPNAANENSTSLNDLAFAIEPFLTVGVGEIYEGKESEIFDFVKDVTPRDRDARALVNFVKENYGTRPFCRRWLFNAGFKKVDFILRVLIREGILHNYPVLIEKDKKVVSQVEHTVLIFDGNVEVVTR